MNGTSPSRSRIAFSTNRDGNEEIYVIDADGANLTRLTNNRGFDSGPAWSPDGTKIAFLSARNEGHGLYVMNADGTNPILVVSGSVREGNGLGAISRPTWSPDATKLAFEGEIPYGGHITPVRSFEVIYVVNADGTNLTLLLTGNPDTDPEYTWSGRSPAWSPSGMKLAYVTSFQSGLRIALMDPNGTFLTFLTTGDDANFKLAWSPNGARIVFAQGNGALGDLYVMKADGTALSQLTNHWNGSFVDGQPDWSPDGTQIAFVSNRDRIFEIYVMNADGTNIRRLTENPSYGLISDPHDSWPSWSPFLKED